MSWWTKNRKVVGPALGLLALNMIPGVGQAISAGLASATGGLLGTGAAAGGAAGAGIGESLAAAKAVGDASLASGGLNAALAAEGGSEAGLAGLKAVADAGLGSASQPIGTALSFGDKALTGLGKVGSVMGPTSTAAGLLSPAPQPMAPPPQQSQFQPTPVSSPYGYGMDMPPPGIDPRQWAMMTPEQKRMFRGMR